MSIQCYVCNPLQREPSDFLRSRRVRRLVFPADRIGSDRVGSGRQRLPVHSCACTGGGGLTLCLHGGGCALCATFLADIKTLVIYFL